MAAWQPKDPGAARYPDELVAHLAALIGTAPAAPGLVLDICARRCRRRGGSRFGYLFQCITVRREA